MHNSADNHSPVPASHLIHTTKLSWQQGVGFKSVRQTSLPSLIKQRGGSSGPDTWSWQSRHNAFEFACTSGHAETLGMPSHSPALVPDTRGWCTTQTEQLQQWTITGRSNNASMCTACTASATPPSEHILPTAKRRMAKLQITPLLQAHVLGCRHAAPRSVPAWYDAHPTEAKRYQATPPVPTKAAIKPRPTSPRTPCTCPLLQTHC